MIRDKSGKPIKVGWFPLLEPISTCFLLGGLARIPFKAMDPNFSYLNSLAILFSFAALGIVLQVRKNRRQLARASAEEKVR